MSKTSHPPSGPLALSGATAVDRPPRRAMGPNSTSSPMPRNATNDRPKVDGVVNGHGWRSL